MFWLGLFIGLLLGGLIFFCMLALCMAAGESDDHAEEIYKKRKIGDNNGNNQSL